MKDSSSKTRSDSDAAESDVDGDSATEEQREEGLTTRTGLVWEWLPTLVAAVFLASFVALVVATATPLPVDVRAIPAEWFVPYVTIVGASAVTTIGADAVASWRDITDG